MRDMCGEHRELPRFSEVKIGREDDSGIRLDPASDCFGLATSKQWQCVARNLTIIRLFHSKEVVHLQEDRDIQSTVSTVVKKRLATIRTIADEFLNKASVLHAKSLSDENRGLFGWLNRPV